MKAEEARSGDREDGIIDLDELRRARERRASSPRRGFDGGEPDRSGRRPRSERSDDAGGDERFGRSGGGIGRNERDDRDERIERAERAVRSERRQGRTDETAPLRPQAQEAKRFARPRERAGRNNGLMLLFLLLALLTLAVVIGLNIFRVTSIEVSGNDTISNERIIELSGIIEGENIFKANLTKARRYIEEDPLLEVKRISRILPDRILIEVRQREPHGVIAYLGSYVVIDENGIALDIRDSLPTGQFPLVTGIEIEPAEKGRRIVGVDDRIMDAMHGLLSALYANGAMQCVSEANISLDGELLLLTAEGLRIDLGHPTDLDAKARWVACTVPELRTKGYTTGVLYITGAGSPVYSADGMPEEGTGTETQPVEGEGAAGEGENESGQNDADGNEPDGPDNAV